jgi:plastocyanin
VRAAAAALLAALAAAPAASAQERIVAGPSNRYLTPSVTMDQGERLTFQNQDVASHDVTARRDGPDARPLFSTPVIGQGREVFVEGSQYLTTGSYGFFCSVHPFMEGTLNVTSAGVPVPRPAPDTRAPAVSVSIPATRLGRVERARRLTVEVNVDEPAAVEVSAKLGRIVVARGAASATAAGGLRVAAKLTRAGRRALDDRRRARLVVTARAQDGAGNAASATAARTLRR